MVPGIRFAGGGPARDSGDTAMRRTWTVVAVVVALSLLSWRLVSVPGVGESNPASARASLDPQPVVARLSRSGTSLAPVRPGAESDVQSSETRRAIDVWERTYLTAIRQHLEARAEERDARAQLTLALMFFAPGAGLSDPAALQRSYRAEEARRADALERAQRMQPDDPLVAWHAALGCLADGEDCDHADRLLRLRELDPDNAAVWLLGLGMLTGAEDAHALDMQLRLAADAGRYDSPLGDTGRLLADALAGVEMPELDAGLREAMSKQLQRDRPITDEELRYLPVFGVWVAQSIPAAGLFQVCVGAAARGDPASCRRIGARLGGSQSMAERLLGLSMQAQLTAGRPEGARWREALRRHYWQFEQYVALAREAPPPGYLRRVLVEGEVDALEWRLARAGQADPPPGWLPANPRHRALVTTGRPPSQD